MKLVSELFDFIKKSPTAYHAAEACAQMLSSCGYTELTTVKASELKDGGKYFIRKNGSSLIAFRYSAQKQGFMIAATHGDSPAFKLKSSSQSGAYTRLNVEKYGGMIYYTWLDRPLSVAGRVYIKTEKGIEERLVDFGRDIATVPSVAIHFNRAVNDGYKFNPAVDMLPLLSTGSSDFNKLLRDELSVAEESIISHDLFVYVRDEGKLIGDGIVLCPRLDDLSCVFASLKAFLTADNGNSVPVFALFDNEEVGSATKQGAASVFFRDILEEIGGSSYAKMLDSSFMVSADNAHAKHPNHPELSDATEAPVLGGGVVVKYNANQRYTTDAYSAAILSELADAACIPLQKYSNRADLAGGGTLGSIANTNVPVPTVDIGIAQLAMHSANETMAASDLSDMVKLLVKLYSSSIYKNGNTVEIK